MSPAYFFDFIINGIHRKRTKNIYLAFGENCLPDNILARYNLKSFTTPFSHGRSNIEYILNLERDNYKDFVNPEYLVYEDFKGDKLSRLKHYHDIKNHYHHLHSNGFEFTHHDVVSNPKHREKFMSRAARLKEFLPSRKYVLLYHHRVHENNDQELLLGHLAELKALYSGKYPCEVVLFQQVIIDKGTRKRLGYREQKGIHIYDFHTHRIWSGRNPKLLWAITDDSLIRKMLRKVKGL